MKKIALLVSAIMVFTMTGCNIKKTGQNIGTAQSNKPIKTTTHSGVTTTGPATTKNLYKNGTFSALGDKWTYGQESATVKIKNDRIVNVILKKLNSNKKEVNYKEWTGKKSKSGKTRPNLNKFRTDMAKRIVSKQSVDVDSISGATVSCDEWKLAVQRALEKAKR